jgi:mono/diheme cytochrome c family protein
MFWPDRVHLVKTRACFAAFVAAVTLAACGGDSGDQGGESTPAGSQPAAGNGAELFTQNCANCHTLAAAKANGQVGPNLDDLRPGPDLVKAQVENGGGAMPAFKGKLSDAEIQAIADYVSENAGA